MADIILLLLFLLLLLIDLMICEFVRPDLRQEGG